MSINKKELEKQLKKELEKQQITPPPNLVPNTVPTPYFTNYIKSEVEGFDNPQQSQEIQGYIPTPEYEGVAISTTNIQFTEQELPKDFSKKLFNFNSNIGMKEGTKESLENKFKSQPSMRKSASFNINSVNKPSSKNFFIGSEEDSKQAVICCRNRGGDEIFRVLSSGEIFVDGVLMVKDYSLIVAIRQMLKRNGFLP